MKKGLFAGLLVTILLAGCGTAELPDNVSKFKTSSGQEYIEKITYTVETDANLNKVRSCVARNTEFNFNRAENLIKASGSTTFEAALLGWSVKYDLFAEKESGQVKLTFFNLMLDVIGSNGGATPAGTWYGARPAKVYESIDKIAKSIETCLKK